MQLARRKNLNIQDYHDGTLETVNWYLCRGNHIISRNCNAQHLTLFTNVPRWKRAKSSPPFLNIHEGIVFEFLVDRTLWSYWKEMDKVVPTIPYTPWVERWGPYLQTCLWEFNMGKLKFSRIICPLVYYHNRSLCVNLRGPCSIPCWRYLDRTLGKFTPIYGPHLYV